VPSRHTQFSVAFTTNIAESNFPYTQVTDFRLKTVVVTSGSSAYIRAT
jgi:hypothetical protein